MLKVGDECSRSAGGGYYAWPGGGWIWTGTGFVRATQWRKLPEPQKEGK